MGARVKTMNKKDNPKSRMYSMRIEPELNVQMKLLAKRKGKPVAEWVRALIYTEVANEMPKQSN